MGHSIYTLRFWRACVRSRKFSRKRLNLDKNLHFPCTEEAGHSIGESANRAVGALISDEAWSVCKTTRRKGDRRRSLDRLAFDGWVTLTNHGLGFETVCECLARERRSFSECALSRTPTSET